MVQRDGDGGANDEMEEKMIFEWRQREVEESDGVAFGALELISSQHLWYMYVSTTQKRDTHSIENYNAL